MVYSPLAIEEILKKFGYMAGHPLTRTPRMPSTIMPSNASVSATPDKFLYGFGWNSISRIPPKRSFQVVQDEVIHFIISPGTTVDLRTIIETIRSSRSSRPWCTLLQTNAFAISYAL